MSGGKEGATSIGLQGSAFHHQVQGVEGQVTEEAAAVQMPVDLVVQGAVEL